MSNPNQELIWQGRIHLGDEPGVYGDAHYAGLCAELPVTIYNRSDTSGSDIVKLILETEDVRTFAGYPGHEVTVTQYEPDPAVAFHWRETLLASGQLQDSTNPLEINVDLAGKNAPIYVSVRVRADTTVAPGLYDDFVLVRLALESPEFRYYASFGFIS